MGFYSVFSYTGIVLEILGILMLVPVIFSWFFGEQVNTMFFAAAMMSFVIGTLMDKKFPKEEINLGSAMMISALSLLFASLFGALPYMLYMNPLDALFESVSGFTTTGLTTVVPESLPASVILWRSMTQWIGGIGIILVFLLIVNSPGISSY